MAFSNILVSAVLAVSLAFLQVHAERHEVVLVNKCGFGTPVLKAQNGDVLSNGEPITIEGELVRGIAYLQTGDCGDNGENCLLVETTLSNGASSTDLSLIEPHEFSVTSGFGYFNGCDGAGADCTNEVCDTALYEPNDTWVQVDCGAEDVALAITFCD